MINAKELHIGCWYNFKNPMWGIEEPMQFNNWTEALDFEGYGSPIPITPEILLACGFTKGDYHKNWFSHPELALRFVMYDDGFVLEACDDIQFSEPFFHLHQLQNIYWCLVGKELIYQPK